MVNASQLVERLRDDKRALPRLMTLVENEDPFALQMLDALFPLTGRAHVIGITGSPGTGKSSLIASLVDRIRISGRPVAVLAIDPSSPVSGGAVLGDRIRMLARFADSGVYVRSMASRGRQGGLAWATAELVHLLDAAGFPLILVETVGTGQDGTDIAVLADSVVVVQSPGLGDGVQAIKAGILEIGDVVVVNKSDQPGADQMVRLLRNSFGLGQSSSNRAVPVLASNALSGEGVDSVLAAIDAHCDWLDQNGDRAVRRERGARAEVLSGLRTSLERRLAQRPESSPALTNAIARVTRREMTPRRAVEMLTAPLTGSNVS
ncbi:MAG: methylmalonyl Co-A mutase-associated GTPase MeaB [Chloroflexota bacterium]|nr:methylmalonyl Co-A mutase-associated GTPase MeaB [Chloroflexota bacterium]